MSRFLFSIKKCAALVRLDPPEWFLLLLMMPLTTAPSVHAAELPPYSAPSVTPTQMPTAFTAEWGNYFISTSSYAYEQWQRNDLFVDGCLNLGAGIGNPRTAVAVEIDYNIESFRGVPEGGSVDVRVGRSVVNHSRFKAAVGGGLLRAFTYGQLSKEPKSAYGVLTMAWPLRPNDASFRQTLQLNLGAGSGRFQRIDQGWLPSQGVVASLGVELAPNVGLSAGWVGRGVNATLSVVPARGVPLFVSLSGVNLDNSGDAGRAAVLSLTWGGSFRTATF
jgi:hypothetical protein